MSYSAALNLRTKLQHPVNSRRLLFVLKGYSHGSAHGASPALPTDSCHFKYLVCTIALVVCCDVYYHSERKCQDPPCGAVSTRVVSIVVPGLLEAYMCGKIAALSTARLRRNAIG